MCCANGSSMWSDSCFCCSFIFLIKKIPEEGKTKHQNLMFYVEELLNIRVYLKV